MTIASSPAITLTMPVGTRTAPVEVPTADAALWARYIVATLAALRAGRRGLLTILHPEPYLRAIVAPRLARLGAGESVRAAAIAEMEAKMAGWMRRQSRVGPTLEVICAALLHGHLRDERGHDVQRIERDPEAADLFIALLGHDARAGHRACSVCDDVAAGDWTRALAATGTPPGVVIDAYRLAVDAGWLPALPDASVRKPPVVRAGERRGSRMITHEHPGGYEEDDL